MAEGAMREGMRRAGWRKLVSLWSVTVVLFGAAAGATILGLAPFMGSDLHGALHGWLGVPVVLTTFFGPGLLASALALRLHYRVRREAGDTPGPGAMFIVTVLTLTAVCVGVIGAVSMSPD